MKSYHGNRYPSIMVFVRGDEGIDEPLSFYYEHVNHSPDGFEWGYLGSGPSQLAFAILFDFTQDLNFTYRHYQWFKRDFIQHLFADEWTIQGKAIQHWCEIFAGRPLLNIREDEDGNCDV